MAHLPGIPVGWAVAACLCPISSAWAQTTPAAGPDLHEGAGWPVELDQGADPDVWLASALAYRDAGRLGPALELADAVVAVRPAMWQAQALAAEIRVWIRENAREQVCVWSAFPDVILAHDRAARAVQPGRDVAPSVSAFVAASWEGLFRDPRWIRVIGPPVVALRSGLPVLEPSITVRRRRLVDAVAGRTFWSRDARLDDVALRLDADGTANRAVLLRDADGQRHARVMVGTWTTQRDALIVQFGDVQVRLRVGREGLSDGSQSWRPEGPDCEPDLDPWVLERDRP